jgi:DNA-binding CsgD family transcriptional regulator
MDKDWEMFASHFDNVHGDFLSALRETYPMLTLTDLKLSAYLRMNLTSKEIAKLLNITVRGVEISRYRLRKKLGIATEVSLYSFFSDFKSRSDAEIKRQDKNVPPIFT